MIPAHTSTGQTPPERFKASLTTDEAPEDAGAPVADRTRVLDNAWRLPPDIARQKYPRPNARAGRAKRAPARDGTDDWSDDES